MRYGAWVFCALVLSSAGATPPWFVRTWQSDEGLPDNSVKGIAQSPDGFIWVATDTGLVRFDGLQFREIPLPTPGLDARTIQALCVDRRGRVWVAREPGIVVCLEQGRTKVMLASKNPPALRRAYQMVEDGEGAVWVTYLDDTLVRFKDGKVRFYTTEDGLPAGGTVGLTVDRGGQLWFLRSGRLGVFREGRFMTLREGAFELITAANDGGVWLYLNKSLARYTEAGGLTDHVKLNTDNVHFGMSRFFGDRSGRLWIGTRLAGLFCYEGIRFDKIDTVNQPIVCMCEDREGNIWVGTRGGGIKQLNLRIAELLTTGENARFGGIQSLCKDMTGQLWAINWNRGTVLRKMGQEWTPLSAREGWTFSYAKCVAADPQGGVWIGTEKYGVSLWRDGVITRNISSANGLEENYVNAIRLTPSGAVWIGGGKNKFYLQCWENDTLQTFKLPPNCGTVTAIEVDASGDCWAATARGHLVRARGTLVTDETHRLLPEPYPIRALLSTPDSSLWIGFGGMGLGRLKEGQFTHCNREQGLHDDYISQILSDGQGRLWLAGNRGIFSLREKNWDERAEGRDTQLQSVVYKQKDGLPGLQASFDSWPNAFRDHEDQLHFAMQSGVLTFYTAAIKPDTQPPAVVIDRVAANGKEVALYGSIEGVRSANKSSVLLDLAKAGAELHLQLGRRQIEISFTVPSFILPESVRLKYRFLGFDQEWIEAGERRSVLYSQLAPGQYTFQVIACNRDGVWNEQGALLTVTVPPFWWETVWFKGAVLLVIIGVIVAVFFLIMRHRHRIKLERFKLLQATELERARIAQDLHDDLGAGLTEIAMLSELTRQDSAENEAVTTYALQIFSSANNMTQALDEIVWAVNPDNDTVEKFIAFVCEFSQALLDAAGLSYRFDMPDRLLEMKLESRIRHQLCMALKESLNNVVKHARATEVKIGIQLNESVLSVTVEDNGVGFDLAAQTNLSGSHNGLEGLRRRLTSIQGTCYISSVFGRGTQVRMEVRL